MTREWNSKSASKLRHLNVTWWYPLTFCKYRGQKKVEEEVQKEIEVCWLQLEKVILVFYDFKLHE